MYGGVSRIDKKAAIGSNGRGKAKKQSYIFSSDFKCRINTIEVLSFNNVTCNVIGLNFYM